MCCSSPCFRVLLCTHYGPLQCFSIYSQIKSNQSFTDHISRLCYFLRLWMNIDPWERNYRNVSSQIFFKIGVLKKFANFTGKQLCWRLFLVKLQGWRPATLLRRDSNKGAMRKKLQKLSFADILQNRCY